MNEITRTHLFLSAIRRAEETDARMHIRENEDQPERRKRDDKDKDEINDDDEDRTSLSVSALISFLRDLLDEAPPQNLAQDPDRSTSPHPHINPQAARAAQAYGRQTSQSAPPPQTSHNTVPLSDEERDALRDVLAQAKELLANHVEIITLRPAPTFLESLQRAVQAAST